jgi:DNA primase
VEFLELKVDPQDPADGVERILFPVFGPDKALYGFSGRDTSGEALLKVRDYAGLEKAKCLLGAHLIVQEKPAYICVVEGLFDYASMWQHGFPAVATMTSTLTKMQGDILKDLGLPVYMFFDADDAGAGAMRATAKALVRHVPIMKVRYPKIWIENPDEKGGGHWVKDPGELLAEDIEEMIRDARLF